MKHQILAATLLAAVAVTGGSALAQVTMQPIPNPPEKPMMAHKHHMKKHHMMKAPMAKASTDMPATDAAPK